MSKGLSYILKGSHKIGTYHSFGCMLLALYIQMKILGIILLKLLSQELMKEIIKKIIQVTV